MANKTEIYISTDIEADGPIPGMNSMLGFGSAAYFADKTLIGTFIANLETLPAALAFRKTTQQKMPKRWFDPLPHSHLVHRALDDAIEQGALFCNMLREMKEGI